ncbi:MAG: class I SAM-dependent methyltransferase [Chitinispirillaceae bacterium]|nr:class I SAM-dependent methyltransferase [Chitinispirillaceae bacterium]
MKNEATKQQFYHQLGSDYYWFAGHYALADMLLARFRRKHAANLLNIGCGPNEFSPASSGTWLISADYSFEACRLAKQRQPLAAVVCCDAQQLPFRNGSIGTVIALELLEHLEQDQLAGREFGRVLERDGIVLVSVPAYRFLWGSHDVWNRHVRRYSTGSFRQLVDGTELRISYLTYYKFLFVIPLFLFRNIKKLLGGAEASHDFLPVPRPLNALLRGYLLFEAVIARRVPLPAGVSLFSVLSRSDHR